MRACRSSVGPHLRSMFVWFVVTISTSFDIVGGECSPTIKLDSEDNHIFDRSRRMSLVQLVVLDSARAGESVVGFRSLRYRVALVSPGRRKVLVVC